MEKVKESSEPGARQLARPEKRAPFAMVKTAQKESGAPEEPGLSGSSVKTVTAQETALISPATNRSESMMWLPRSPMTPSVLMAGERRQRQRGVLSHFPHASCRSQLCR